MKVVKKYYKITIWTLCIAYACFSPADSYKDFSFNIPYIDKVIHFVMFLVIGVLIKPLFNNRKLMSLIYIALYTLYACFTELIQYYFIESRNGSIYDLMADLSGLAIGIIIFNYLPKMIRLFIEKY